jgi:hypothetical protein
MIKDKYVKSFVIHHPGDLRIQKVSFLVEKTRISSGVFLKKTRAPYGANVFYYLNDQKISKDVYDVALEEKDNSFSSLKKITDVFYSNNSQMRIDYYLKPRFGLVLLKTQEENDIPNFLKLVKEVTHDFSYQEKFILNDHVDFSVKNLTHSILPPA